MALLVPFLQRLWYDAVLDWGLNPGPPALKASTIPLGYRGGGGLTCQCQSSSRTCVSRVNFALVHMSLQPSFPSTGP